MPLTASAMTASHGWASTVALAALYRPTSQDNGTPVELSTPGYTRRPVSLVDAGTGLIGNQVTFSIAAGTTVAWWGLLTIGGTLLSLEPISASILSNIPQPILFSDTATGWAYAPAQQPGRGEFIVMWSGPAPGATSFPTGAYTTLPSNIWIQGAYTFWSVREIRLGQVRLNDRVGMSSAALLGSDALIPSNRGWGYWQRMDPVTYAADGTYILNPVHVRTIG